VEDIWHQQLFRFDLKKDLPWQALYMLIRHDLEIECSNRWEIRSAQKYYLCSLHVL